MRRPKILQQFRRRVIRAPTNVLSDYPVSFRVVMQDRSIKGEVTVPRNRLGKLIEFARTNELYGLSTVGLHGVTRLQCREAKALSMDLRALLRLGESVDPTWLALVEIVASDATATLVVSAGL